MRFDLVKNLSLREKHIQMKFTVSIKFRKVEYEQIIVHLDKT